MSSTSVRFQGQSTQDGWTVINLCPNRITLTQAHDVEVVKVNPRSVCACVALSRYHFKFHVGITIL
jgi:hypothetical protein